MLRFDWKYLQNLAQDGGSDGEVSPGIKFGHCSVWLRIFLGLGKSDHRKSPGTHIFSQSLADGRDPLGMPYRGLSAEHVVTPMQAHRQGTQQDPPTSDTARLPATCAGVLHGATQGECSRGPPCQDTSLLRPCDLTGAEQWCVGGRGRRSCRGPEGCGLGDKKETPGTT